MKTLRIRSEDLELVGVDGGGVEILHYKGKPFTGICLTYEDAGWLSVEEEFQNGYQEGWVRLYYENGQLEEEYFMHNNIMDPDLGGAWDEQGNPI
jgi:antitoxin component YwqK of YwqJK toxin-antitoxin module